MLGASGVLLAADAVRPDVAPAAAPAAADSGLQLSRHLYALPRKQTERHPVFVAADRISGRNDTESVAEGHVEIRKLDTVLTADKLTYWQETDEVEATGNVRLMQNDDVISGPKLRLRLEESMGFFESPQYSIKRAPSGALLDDRTTGSGQASRLDFEGENHYRLTDATYSTCGPTDPDWFVRTGSLSLDYSREVGEANDATLVFLGTPILHTPWLNFSLNNKRKSGFLTPTIRSTSKSGFEFVLPYYWNIAPNMDATLAPHVIARRGLELDGEFRYLESNYSGTARLEYLPDDALAHRSRGSYSLLHNQEFGAGLSGSLSLNGVSDDTYFTDLSSRLANTAQTNLLRQGLLTYASTWWKASIMAQSYQTLQDPALPPVAVPYRRLPQITLNAYRGDLPLDSSFVFNGEYVNFSHPTQQQARRTTFYPQLALPIEKSYFFITPKIGLHATRYQLDQVPAGSPDQLSRNVPIFSVDSGLVFERNAEWNGRDLVQTLEPRLYYLYVPTRDQNRIPVFDTGLADFNFAQIFSDNRYVGGDRIGDANQVTVAAVSRFIDPATGTELLRGALGQRYYFKSQEVVLPAIGAQSAETPRTDNMADFLAALSGQALSKTHVDGAWQYNPRENRTERLSLGVRYQPELAKVLNVGYRYSRDLLGQVDVSAQWPLWDRWSGVGRYNYSLKESRLIEGVVGLEYAADCWAMRFVVQQIATASGISSSSLMFQLELNGFSRIGSNPTELLKRSIPGYGRPNQPVVDPAFTTNATGAVN